MFRKLRVKNFRSVKDSRSLSLSALNILVGPNNSGKSSILHAILLLKQTLQDKDPRAMIVTSGPEVDLGSYVDLIRGHDPDRKLVLGFELEEKPLAMPKFVKFSPEVEKAYGPFRSFELTWRFKPARNVVELEAFRASDEETKKQYAGKQNGGEWVLKGIPYKLKPYATAGFFHFVPYVGIKGKPPKDKKIVELGVGVSLTSRMQANNVGEVFENVRYVGPIRERIPYYGVLGTMPYTELGPSGQNLMRVLSAKRGPLKKTVVQELDYWLDKRFKVAKNVRILDLGPGKTIKALLADDPGGSRDINLAAMGSGLSQIVPVIVQTVLTPPNGCLIVEQPEIHLHPAAQATLADLFVEYTKKEKGPQFIIETHSEHFVLRIRRRVAEGKLPSSLVTIFFVQKERGQTKLRALKLRDNGQFVRWPRGFFEEGYKEAMALAEAQVR